MDNAHKRELKRITDLRDYYDFELVRLNREIESKKRLRRETLRTWVRAGLRKPSGMFFENLHRRLAAKIERREYELSTRTKPGTKERDRLFTLQDRDHAVAEEAWRRMRLKEAR